MFALSLSLFANMEGLEGLGESRSQSNCPTLDNERGQRPKRPRLRLSSGIAVACLLVVSLSSVSSANMLAENLRERMHTDYLSGDAGEHSFC